MKKNLKYGILCLFVISGLFAGCIREPGEKRLVSKASVSFDISNAKALASVRSDDILKNARAANSDSPILKILEDGSTELAINTEGSNINLAKALAIIPSPKENSKDAYIIFEDLSSWKDIYLDEDDVEIEETHWLGELLYVHEDGTVIDILKVSEPGENGTSGYNYLYKFAENTVLFDNSGNAYYLVRELDGGRDYTVVYKFNPDNNQINQLTAKVRDTYYENFNISSDGQYLIVGGRRIGSGNTSSSTFINYIPVNNPNNTGIIWRTSSNDAIEYYYDYENDIIYCFGDLNGSGDWDLNISKRTSNGYEQLHILQKGRLGNESSPINCSTYEWLPELNTTEKKLNFFFELCDKFVEKEIRLGKFFKNRPELLDKYSDEFATIDTNEEAIAWLDESPEHREAFDTCWFTYSMTGEIARKNLVFKKGTEETAYNTALDDFGIPDVSDLFFQHISGNTTSVFTNKDGLWEFYSTMRGGKYVNVLFQLTDKDGNFILKANDLNKLPIPEGRVTIIQQKNDKLYASYSTLLNGFESGYQHILEFNLEENQAVDLFDAANVPNKDYLEVISFSVGKNKLYFSAVNGIDVKNGSIDLLSDTYSEVSNEQSFDAICSFE